MAITTMEHVFLQLALEAKARGESTKEADDEAYEALAAAQQARMPEWFRPIYRTWQNIINSRPQLWESQPSTTQTEYTAMTCPRKIGRAHVSTPVANAHIVCRMLLEKKQ